MTRLALRPAQDVAVVAALAGVLSAISALPSALRFLLLAVFVLAGPGCAVIDLLPTRERPLRLLLVPAIGISAVLLATTVSVDYDLWNPRAVLGVLAGLTIVITLGVALLQRPRVKAAGSTEIADDAAADPVIGSRS